jgi:hypothetical protein
MRVAEFSRFVVLMNGLAPYLVLLVAAGNRNRRQDRCPMIGRRNLEFFLDGHPDAVPLFTSVLSSPALNIRRSRSGVYPRRNESLAILRALRLLGRLACS